MAKSDGSVIIDTLVDTKGFGKGINTMEKQMGGLSKTIRKLGLAIGFAFAVGKLVQFGKEAIELGSDLQEVQNVVDVTFTTMSDKVNEFAQGAAEAAGLSETMAKRYMGTFGAMSKSFGFMEEEAFAMSASLTQAVGDVASFYNLSQDEAYTKLKSVFTGETESLKDLGVVMTKNALDAYAMAEGWGVTTDQMNEQQKVALRYRFVLDQLSAASGDFQRTSGSWANQMRILQLNIESLKANIGQGLINIFTPILKVINKIISKIAELSAYFVAFSELISGKQTSSGGGSPGKALQGISDGYGDVEKSADGAAKAQNKYISGLDEIRTYSEESQPVSVGNGNGNINLGEIDLGDLGSELNDPFKDANTLIDGFKSKIEGLIKRFPVLGNIANTVKNAFNLLYNIGKDLFNLLIQPIADNAGGFLTAAGNIASFVGEIIGRVLEGFDSFVEKLLSVYNESISPVIQNITGGISELVGKFLNWFNNDIGPVLERWGKKFDEIWTEHVDPLLANLAEFFGEVFDNINELWNDLIQPFIAWIIDNILPVLTPIIETIGDVILETFGVVADVLSGLIDVFSGVITFLTGVFTLDWERAWNGIKDIFGGICDAMVGVFKAPFNVIIGVINGVMDGIAGAVNLVIRGINSLSFTVPGWVPGVGGKSIGFDIPELVAPNIPYLATGAVIPPNAPFMAVLGDQRNGTNIEAPLDTIKQAVAEVVGSGGTGLYQFVAQINRRVLFDEVIEEAKIRQDIYGNNPFDLKKGANA